MALTEIVTKPIKNLILPAATASAIALGANEANAQGFEIQPSKPAQEKKEEQKPTTPSRDYLDGYVRAEGRTSPSENALFGDWNLTFKPINDLKLSVEGFHQFAKYDSEEGEDTDITSHQLMFGIGGSPTRSKSFELFLRGKVGYEWNDFSGSVNKLDAQRFIVGGQAGIASQDIGTRLLVSSYWGKGKADYELLSGFSGDGDFNRFFLSGEFSQRLFGNGRKQIGTENPFDVNYVGEEFEWSFGLALQGFLSNDRIADLQKTDGWGFKAGLPFVYNPRSYTQNPDGSVTSEGILWKFTPFFEWKNYDTSSDISARTTKSDLYRIGIRAEAELTRWMGVYVEGGYDWKKIKMDDPAQEMRKEDEDNGLEAALGLYVKF